ncbi:nucleotidyltransferase AbiEii toxin of type IV toxin-antitoxin system [Methylosinus sp. sav-2]|uniref:nucleotidyl transferase AbiEii/AbiGii toxin family protein n=1 Tax=Methylosinus sp. sav-2 TaxID=2485168 RepID=UPI00068F5D95|nr:nucleotidyl transferase AbiEii/AbiGii toxin family protein [Methylosinus sp. sav-2]TDX64943.1 nucleotidyltransferase AbiEii toxin of type IV toxin-antitoxin system [Methylosinus sp. sav-2]
MLTPLLDALPAPQRGLWPLLARIPRHYALYGGTAIALRLGHRTSVDFDFFSDVPLDDDAKGALLAVLQKFGRVSVLQSERNTLTVSVSRDDEPVKLKVKVIHDRAEGKDYQDIAAMLAIGQSLAHGLAAVKSLFGPAVPAMITLKALSYFDDVNESWRVTEDVKTTISSAIEQLSAQWSEAPIVLHALGCVRAD